MIEASPLPGPAVSHLRGGVALPDPVQPGGWRDDLRFFGIVYALGLVFFLLLLS